MTHENPNARPLRRRDFLATTIGGSLAGGMALSPFSAFARSNASSLEVGEGVVDITPPLGIEMGGFHRSPGKERRVLGIRQATAVRALVLRCGETCAAIVSADIAAVGREMAGRVKTRVAQQLGIAASNVCICATHTHSMPSFCYLRQWGAIPTEYMATVERKMVRAIQLAVDDLAPAELSVGRSRAVGANHNRTTKEFKTDAELVKDSTEEERWLDTMVRALVFQRPGRQRDLLWYHFSAHSVCYADDLAGPDWPGAVADRIEQSHGLKSSFLQGHAGDVNPGDGDPWRGDIQETTDGVYAALCRAVDSAERVPADQLRTGTQPFEVPYDMARFEAWLDAYRTDPAACKSGQWVDAGFAEDWFRGNSDRDIRQTGLPIVLSAMRLGDVGFVFHPAELYSYYGLAIQRDSPFPDTLVVGYCDDMIGYLPDRRAYEAGEYAATTVPKILDYPPFTPSAAQEVTTAAIGLLKGLAG